MAFSTFTGPVRSGTVKNTTGTTLGTIDNTGLVVLSQSAALGLATTTPFVIPAGTQIMDIYIDVTTTFTTSSMVLLLTNTLLLLLLQRRVAKLLLFQVLN